MGLNKFYVVIFIKEVFAMFNGQFHRFRIVLYHIALFYR